MPGNYNLHIAVEEGVSLLFSAGKLTPLPFCIFFKSDLPLFCIKLVRRSDWWRVAKSGEEWRRMAVRARRAAESDVTRN
jgi:hypothetical protein